MLPPKPVDDPYESILSGHQNAPLRSGPLASVVHAFKSSQEGGVFHVPRLGSSPRPDSPQHQRPHLATRFRSSTSRLLSSLGRTGRSMCDAQSSTSSLDTSSSVTDKEIRIWPFSGFSKRSQHDPRQSTSSVGSHRSPEDHRTREISGASSSAHRADRRRLPSSHTPSPIDRGLQSIMDLHQAHSRKPYMSGPLLRRMEREPSGRRMPRGDGWTEVWAQLIGTELCIWDTKATKAAARRGAQVPPTYVNIIDAVGVQSLNVSFILIGIRLLMPLVPSRSLQRPQRNTSTFL